MKSYVFSAMAILLLSACATGPSAYGPATNTGSLGFENTKIESDRFRINYTGRSSNEASDYALLRAAEITLAEDYSHFGIISGGTFDEGSNRSGVSTSVGFGTSRGYYGRGSSVGVGVNLNDVGRLLNGKKITNSIEIKLLRSGSADSNVFNAQSVVDNIRPKAFQ